MAHYLQGLIFSLLSAADFSHELHLKLMPSCGQCHAKAASSTQISDNLLPSLEVCGKCHPAGTVAVKQPRATVLAKFDHSFHVKMGPAVAASIALAVDKKRYLTEPGPQMRRHLNTKNACGACHRGMEESRSTTAAGAGHLPHMADCLTCHNQKIDPPDSCNTCHDSEQMTFRPANHTSDFLDRHTTKKAGLDISSCAVCHGRTFTCLGCH